MTAVIRAFLFDLDGTLIDHEAAAALALTQALRVIPGLDHRDHARARARWKELEEQAMARYLSGHLTFTEQRRLRVISLAAELGLGAWDDTRADAWFTGYLRHYEAAWRTYRDVRPALDALTEQHPDLRLGVLTNGDADQQRTKLRSVGLADELTPVIASSEAGAANPAAGSSSMPAPGSSWSPPTSPTSGTGFTPTPSPRLMPACAVSGSTAATIPRPRESSPSRRSRRYPASSPHWAGEDRTPSG
jgi:FMN phosphatase YigB (HAD superfamily)